MGFIERVDSFFLEPGNSSFRGSPAESGAIEAAQARLGVVFDSSYVEFLKKFGGSFVGVPVYGFNNSRMLEASTVVDLTERFRSDGWPGLEGRYVVSMDMQGNPVMIDRAGKVWIYDHDAREARILADSFEAFVLDAM